MIYTPMTKKALAVCFEAHKSQVDKSGLPYVFHPFHLAEQMKDEMTTIVALLHDMGFPAEAIAAIQIMTHDKSIPYMDYVAQIKKNPIAREVKLADLKHNSDLTRLNEVAEKDLERLKKYKKAISLLEE